MEGVSTQMEGVNTLAMFHRASAIVTQLASSILYLPGLVMFTARLPDQTFFSDLNDLFYKM